MATDRNFCRCLVFAYLAPVFFTSGYADDRQSASLRSAASENDLRRQLRGQSYLLVQKDGDDFYQLWLFDDDGSDVPIVAPVPVADAETSPDADRWSQAMVDRHAADPETRIDALEILAEIDEKSAVTFLRDALADPDSAVRVSAIGFLGESGETGILAESWWQVPTVEQIHIVDALGDIETVQSTAFLKVVANSSNATVAAAASQYLEERH